MQQEGLERNGCDIMEDKIGKGERLITLLQFSRFPPPIQFLCCSKSNPKKRKSDNPRTCMRVRVHTHTHTHTQSSLRKNCKLLSKANESLYNLTLTYFFHELFHPLPNLCCPWKTSEAGTLHLLFPQSITLSYLLFTWLTSTHPSVLISYFYLSWEDFHDCLPAPAYETELGALLMFCHHHSIYHTAL